MWVIWRSFGEELIIEFGAGTMWFQEEMEEVDAYFGFNAIGKQGKFSDWFLSHFYLEGERIKAKLQLSLIKK